MDLGRRQFLRGKERAIAAPIRPPWTREDTVGAACTGCGDCVPVCPERLIFLDAGTRPALDLRRGECTFCAACADACRAPVFLYRNEPPFAHVATVGSACLSARGVVC